MITDQRVRNIEPQQWTLLPSPSPVKLTVSWNYRNVSVRTSTRTSKLLLFSGVGMIRKIPYHLSIDPNMGHVAPGLSRLQDATAATAINIFALMVSLLPPEPCSEVRGSLCHPAGSRVASACRRDNINLTAQSGYRATAHESLGYVVPTTSEHGGVLFCSCILLPPFF